MDADTGTSWPLIVVREEDIVPQRSTQSILAEIEDLHWQAFYRREVEALAAATGFSLEYAHYLLR